jgi:hypothetical protein
VNGATTGVIVSNPMIVLASRGFSRATAVDARKTTALSASVQRIASTNATCFIRDVTPSHRSRALSAAHDKRAVPCCGGHGANIGKDGRQIGNLPVSQSEDPVGGNRQRHQPLRHMPLNVVIAAAERRACAGRQETGREVPDSRPDTLYAGARHATIRAQQERRMMGSTRTMHDR